MIYKHWHHVRGASSRVVARERERSEGRRSSGRNKNFYQIIPSLGATFRQRGENKTQKQLRHRTKSDFGVHIQPHEEFRTAEQFFPFIPFSIPVRESQFAIPQIPNPFWALILYTYNFRRGKGEINWKRFSLVRLSDCSGENSSSSSSSDDKSCFNETSSPTDVESCRCCIESHR